MQGLILTQAFVLRQYLDALTEAKMNTSKVITGWGLANGWTNEARKELLTSCPNNIVRTVAGDPSYNHGAMPLPEKKLVELELAPWMNIADNTLWVELGNEPNIKPVTQDFAYSYRWHLQNTLDWARKTYPKVKFIAPAPLLGAQNNQEQFLQICADVYKKFDAIAVHMYEHDSFNLAEQKHGTTGQYSEFLRLYNGIFPGHPLMITEYGINDPDTSQSVKGSRYSAFVNRRASPILPNNVIASVVYHFCSSEDIDPQYHFGKLAQRSFSR